MSRLLPLLLLAAAAACSEYNVGAKDDHPGADDDTAGGPGSGGGGGSGGDGTGDGSDDVYDSAHPDACFEPEDGFQANPAARIFTQDGTTPVTVTFAYSDTAYTDRLDLDAPVATYLVEAWSDPVGTTLTVGPFAAGVELVFGIDVFDTGMHWQSGPASRNADGVDHVAVTYEGGCSWLIGFEDLTGGGDRDFNDVVLRVQGMLRQER